MYKLIQTKNPSKDEIDNQPTIYELSRVIAQMNGGKAPGHDRINTEQLKYGGCRLNEILHKVLLYDLTEGAPQDWNNVSTTKSFSVLEERVLNKCGNKTSTKLGVSEWLQPFGTPRKPRF